MSFEGYAETKTQKKARMLQPLKIVHTRDLDGSLPKDIPTYTDGMSRGEYLIVLSNLAIAQSNMIRNTKHTKAWPHYVALCKEIERVGGFTYAPYEGDY